MTVDELQRREEAFDQLRDAQILLADGRRELTAAHEKIARAQVAIDDSATTIRDTVRNAVPTARRHSRPDLPALLG